MSTASNFTDNKNAGILLVLALVLILSATTALAFEPVYQPRLNADRIETTIRIDGELDDPGWARAGLASNFVEQVPGYMTEPEVETKAYVTYDDSKLYIAFICDDDPSSIRATMSQRDDYFGDDEIGVFIDTYGDASWAYQFFVNPYGIQKDALWSSIVGRDLGYNLIWESAAKVTESGYQVELAIPFASMRFPNEEVQKWKVDFRRTRPRESYTEYSWAAYDRDEQCGPCQWGNVGGIANVQPGKGVEILPTLIANQSGALTDYNNPDSPFDNKDIDGEMSLGGKYAVNSDITIEASYNPDFSQIEADAAQIDVNSTIALFYPERRPFFQEGSDIFRTLFNSFYTRTINDPVFSSKITGRMDRWSVGFISAADENTPYAIPLKEQSRTLNAYNSYVNALRVSRSFGEASRFGALLTDRRYEGGGSGSIAALDGVFRLSRSYSIDGQWILSHTTEPDDHSRSWFFGQDKPDTSAQALAAAWDGWTFDDGKHTVLFDGESYYGSAFITRFRRNARNWNFILDYNQVSPSYRTQTGYDPLIDYRNASIYSNYHFYPSTGLFERITPQFYVSGRWHFDGKNKWEQYNASVDGRLRFAQTYVSLSYGSSNESYGLGRYNDLWGAHFNLNSRPADRIGCGFDINHGRQIARFANAKGTETSYGFYLDLKPFDRLIIEPNLEFARMELENAELYSGYIARTRLRFQANKQLSLRLVVQYNDFTQAWDIDPLLTYRISSFSVFYVGSAYDYNEYVNSEDFSSRWGLSSRQFFMKLQYLFQI